MKCLMLVLLGLATLVAARPDSVIDISEEDIHQSMEVGDDNTMTGSFSWTSPEGTQYFVKYIADSNGFRILESNAVPATVQGVKADGTQGSFFSSEEFDDDDHDDFFDDDDRK